MDTDMECPDRALWEGIFWMEACIAVSRPVEWLQLNTFMEGVREIAYEAGALFALGSSDDYGDDYDDDNNDVSLLLLETEISPSPTEELEFHHRDDGHQWE